MGELTPTIDTKTCLICGDKFCKRSTESRKYWETKKYCSLKCSLTKTGVQYQPNDKRFTKGHIPWTKGKKGIHLSSKTEFQKGVPSLRKGKKFPELSGKNSHAWKEKVLMSCEVCRKDMILQPWDAKRRRFCGRGCWAKGTRGRGSPVYKGENAKTPLRTRVMELPEYKEWHAAILKRDNYRCVLCQARKLLEVDHIKRFLHIVKDIKTIEEARDCEELWDIKNGRTLCRPCHRKTDTYGTTGLKKHY